MHFNSQIKNYAFVAVFGCTTLLSLSVASAQQRIAPTKWIDMGPPKIVDAQQNFVMAPAVAPHVQFRPTMGRAAYDAAKAQADSQRVAGAVKPYAAGTAVPSPAVPSPLTLILKSINFNGAHKISAFERADTTGAIGVTHLVEVTNSYISMWVRNVHPTGTSLGLVKNMTLNNFFGYNSATSTQLYDPRVIHDAAQGRWIVTAVGSPESTPNTQFFFIGVSRTDDPTGRYFVYQINADFFLNGNLYDFPQVGMDSGALLFTANIFDSVGNPLGADFFAVSKARLYNGLSFTGPFPLFTALGGTNETVTPPIVLDGNTHSFLLGNHDSTTLRKYTVTNSSSPSMITVVHSDVTVPSYSVAPNAPQPGSTTLLDTGDTRFSSNTTQSGNDLWATHCIALGGFASNFFYRINTVTNAVAQSGFYYLSNTSHDFNPSIAANSTGDCFVSYNSTDLTVSTAGLPSDVVSGKLNADPTILASPQLVAFTSPTAYTGSGGSTAGWGDYSATVIDPSNDATAWSINEKVNTQGHDSSGSSLWGSRIVKFGN